MTEEEKIAKNIRDIRNAYGETQAELAEVLGVARNTISMYESDKNHIDTQKLQAIADHYGVPVDRLMQGDFSEMDFKVDSLTWEKMIGMFEVMFPIICADTAMQNPHFEKGYLRTQKIWEKIKNPYEGIMSNEIKRALEEYEESIIDNPEIVESAANMLWLTFMNYALMPDEYAEKMSEAVLYGKALKKDFVKKFVLKNPNSISKENEANKKEFVRNSQEVMLTLIRILKESPNYADLADYYMVIRYAIGMVDNEHGDSLNKTIGIEMLISFAKLGNKYALNYFKMIQSW